MKDRPEGELARSPIQCYGRSVSGAGVMKAPDLIGAVDAEPTEPARTLQINAVRDGRIAQRKEAEFDRLIWPTLSTSDETIPGWTGESKWNYSNRSGLDMRPGRRFRDLRKSTAFTGVWSVRRSAAPFRRTARRGFVNSRSWGRSENTSTACWKPTGKRRENSGIRRIASG